MVNISVFCGMEVAGSCVSPYWLLLIRPFVNVHNKREPLCFRKTHPKIVRVSSIMCKTGKMNGNPRKKLLLSVKGNIKGIKFSNSTTENERGKSSYIKEENQHTWMNGWWFIIWSFGKDASPPLYCAPKNGRMDKWRSSEAWNIKSADWSFVLVFISISSEIVDTAIWNVISQYSPLEGRCHQRSVLKAKCMSSCNF